MSYEANANIGPIENNTYSNMPGMAQYNAQMPAAGHETSTAMGVTYPEIYYKLKPYILMVRDSLASTGTKLTQEELERISDNIYDDLCSKDPGIKEYLSKYESRDPAGDPPARGGAGFRGGPGFGGGFRSGFGGFRRRGLGRDFIDALLLAELYGSPYYPYAYPYPYSPYPYY